MHTATVVPSLPKIALRVDALARRKAYARSLSAGLRGELEERLSRNVIPRLGATTAIAGYFAMRDEVDPSPILVALVATGHVVALPWFAARDAVMIFREAPAITPGPWGIRQPADDAAAVRPDVVLVPLVATDSQGNRIGHGKGHYDRALSRLRANGSVRTIGLCWDCQIVDSTIPADPWDIPLDAVATPTRWIERTS